MSRPKWLLLLGIVLLIAPAVQAQVPEPTPLPLYALPDARTTRVYTSSSLALTTNGGTLVAANMLNNTVSFVEVVIPTAARLITEVPVGLDPRSVAITPDSNKVLVTLHGEDSLAVLDFQSHNAITKVPLGGSASLSRGRRYQ